MCYIIYAKVYFPRIILPVTAVLDKSFDFLLHFVLLLVVIFPVLKLELASTPILNTFDFRIRDRSRNVGCLVRNTL